MLNILLQYIYNNLIAMDLHINTLLGGNPHETLSARIGREYPNSFVCKVVDFLMGKNHCKDVATNGDGAKEII